MSSLLAKILAIDGDDDLVYKKDIIAVAEDMGIIKNDSPAPPQPRPVRERLKAYIDWNFPTPEDLAIGQTLAIIEALDALAER